MAKDSLARGAQSAVFPQPMEKDAPIVFRGTVADEEAPQVISAAQPDELEESLKRAAHAQYIAQCEPQNGRVLLKRIDLKLSGLVVQPEQFAQRSNMGEVISIASECACFLKAGDKVLFGEYNAEPLVLDGQDYLLLDHHDIRLKLPR